MKRCGSVFVFPDLYEALFSDLSMPPDDFFGVCKHKLFLRCGYLAFEPKSDVIFWQILEIFGFYSEM